MKKLLPQYNLQSIHEIMNHPRRKDQWKKEYTSKVKDFWYSQFKEDCILFPSLEFLTGTYLLQTNRAVFNQFSVNPTCKICTSAAETRIHFLTRCESLETTRKPYLDQISSVLDDLGIPLCKYIMSDPKLLTQLLLDPSSPCISSKTVITKSKSVLRDLNHISNKMVHALHLKRIALLNLC